MPGQTMYSTRSPAQARDSPHVRRGNDNQGSATELSISKQTVRAHAKSIYRKLRVAGRLQAILLYLSSLLGALGERRGLIDPILDSGRGHLPLKSDGKSALSQLV